MSDSPREVVWIGSSRKDYTRLPHHVQLVFGQALGLAQEGRREIHGAKPLSHGILKGLGVVELIEDFEGDTYRAVYTAKIGAVLAVLHVFKKKSKSGAATPLREIRLIRKRYRTAYRRHSKWSNNRGRR